MDIPFLVMREMEMHSLYRFKLNGHQSGLVVSYREAGFPLYIHYIRGQTYIAYVNKIIHLKRIARTILEMTSEITYNASIVSVYISGRRN